jgi:predicted permease
MLGVVLNALLPVVVTLGLGVIAGWRHDEDMKAALSLNRMVFLYALPLALFAGTVVIPRTELLSDWALLLAISAGTFAPFLAAYIGARTIFGRPMQASALQAMAFGFPAIAFIGIPILTPLIGSKATIVVDVAGLTGNLVILPVTLLLLSFGQTLVRSPDAGKPASGRAAITATILPTLGDALFQPVVLSPAIAILFVLIGLQTPAILTSSFKLLGSTVGGLSLFASGIILRAQSPKFSLPASASTLARLLLIPGLVYIGLTLTGADANLRKMSVLALAIPAAPMQVILATRYHTDESENAAFLLYSYVLCIPTLAFFIWLTG